MDDCQQGTDCQGAPCRICGEATEDFCQAQVLNKYQVSYFRCTFCGSVQTEAPYWLEEAYCAAITDSDIGLVARNIILSKVSRLIISSFFNSKGSFLDYGGGYGLLVRLMRDCGFDFYRSDKHCANLFAADFEARAEAVPYELLTAFELLEHLTEPLETLLGMRELSGNILCTTELLPEITPKPGDWWYYIPEHGQHVTFYTLKSLRILAEKLGLQLYSNGINIHLFTPKKLSRVLFRLTTSYKLASLFALLPADQTLIAKDCQNVLSTLKRQAEVQRTVT
jgi:hypothetical protein